MRPIRFATCTDVHCKPLRHVLHMRACVPQVYKSMMHAARGIYKDQGVAGLYRGLGVTLIEIVPYAALQFGLYDALSAAWTSARVGGWVAVGDKAG